MVNIFKGGCYCEAVTEVTDEVTVVNVLCLKRLSDVLYIEGVYSTGKKNY